MNAHLCFKGHLGALQDSRRQLMVQLEGLMRMLKSQQTSSPRSTPNSSPRSGKSPPMPQGNDNIISRWFDGKNYLIFRSTAAASTKSNAATCRTNSARYQ